MLFEKRYVFNSHVVAAAAHIRRFKDSPVQLETWFEGSAALPPTGGSLRSQSARKVIAHADHGFVMSLECAHSSITGDFTDPALGYAHTLGKRLDEVTPVRVVSETSVTKLNVQNRLLIEQLELRTVEDDGDGRSPVRFSVPSTPLILDVRVDGKPVAIDIDHELLSFPNVTALEREYEANGDFRKQYQDRFYTATGEPGGRQIPRIRNLAVASLVRNLSFPEGLPAGAKQENRNTISLDNFGTIIFGEYSLGDRSRLVTLVRLKLGSNWGGDGSFASRDSYPVGDPQP